MTKEITEKRIKIDFDASYINALNVDNVLVLQKKDIELLGLFLRINSHIRNIKIDLVQNSFMTKGNNKLEPEDYNRICKILEWNFEFVHPFSFNSINYMNDSLKQYPIDLIQRYCFKYKQLLIDVVEDKMYSCCNYNQSIEFNKNNLLLYIEDKLFNRDCGDCVNHIFYYIMRKKR